MLRPLGGLWAGGDLNPALMVGYQGVPKGSGSADRCRSEALPCAPPSVWPWTNGQVPPRTSVSSSPFLQGSAQVGEGSFDCLTIQYGGFQRPQCPCLSNGATKGCLEDKTPVIDGETLLPERLQR